MVCNIDASASKNRRGVAEPWSSCCRHMGRDSLREDPTLNIVMRFLACVTIRRFSFDPDDPVFLLRKNSSPPLEIKQVPSF